MKILFILTYYHPHWTGLTQYAKRLAEGLAKKGYDTEVLTTKHEQNLKENERVNGVKVKRASILFRLSRTLISPQMILALWKNIKKADKVIVYLPFAEVILVTFFTKILAKKLYLIHNGDLILPDGTINSLIERFYYYSTFISIKYSQAVIIQTEDYGHHSSLLSRFKDKWKVLLPLYEEQIENREITARLSLALKKNKPNVVGFAGRFVEEKGFDLLLKAIPSVLKRVPDTQFVFAGETRIPYEDFFLRNKRLTDQNKENLVLLGRLNQREMPSFYKLIKLLVISSRSDCFPSVGVEAMIMGKPIVVTDIPGARWQVKATGMGKVIKKESPKDLADGIVEVINSQEIFAQQLKKAKEIFKYEKTLAQYQEILG